MTTVVDSPGSIYTEVNAIYQPHPAPSHESMHEPQTRTATGLSKKAFLDGIRRKRRTLSLMSKKHFVPDKPVGDAPSILQQIKKILFGLNILLFCIPASWAAHFAFNDQHVLKFVLSFLAIIPLAGLLSLATDELLMRVGSCIAELMAYTLGNAVQLIVAIIAIAKCELQVTQSSLVGSILSNLLLVLGMCFFAGGIHFQEQGFGASAAQINSSLLTLSVIAVLLPTAFHFAVQPSTSGPQSDPLTDPQEKADLEKLSHGIAIILLIIYVSYLIFQLWSHASLYKDNHEANFKSTKHDEGVSAHAVVDKVRRRFRGKHAEHDIEKGDNHSSSSGGASADGDAAANSHVHVNGSAVNGETSHVYAPGANTVEGQMLARKEEERGEIETLSLSFPECIGLFILSAICLAVTANFFVDSIDGATKTTGISKEWIGLILLPVAGGAIEQVPTVATSVKDEVTRSIGAAVGSSIQNALFVIPLTVVIAWGLGKPLLLLFDPFESVTLFLAVLTVNYCVQDGKSNWLEGMILICLYVIIAVSFWFYPGNTVTKVLNSC